MGNVAHPIWTDGNRRLGPSIGRPARGWLKPSRRSQSGLSTKGWCGQLGLRCLWWLLTNYPSQNDVLTILDGLVLIGYILVTAIVIAATLTILLALATQLSGKWSWVQFHHLAQTLIPLAGCGVFLGLSALSVTLLRAEGFALQWIGFARIGLLAGAFLWSVWLGWRVAGLSAAGVKQGLATGCVALAAGVGIAGWALLFWAWA